MKKVILLLLGCIALFTTRAYSQTASNNLSDAEKAYILSRFNTEVKYNFVFYNDLTFDWDSLCLATLPELLETKSTIEYIKKLKHLCTKLSDGHTSIIADRIGENANWIKPWPMKTRRVENKVFVTEVLTSDFQRQGLEKGCEVLKIDGMDVIDYVNKYKRPYQPSSTPQWLDYAPYNEFELTKDIGSKVSEIVFRNLKGKTFTITSHRNIKWDITQDMSIFDYNVLPGNTGLLKIKSFVGNDFAKQFNELYPEIEKTDALIIDLRNNTGGNSGYADYIIRHLSDKPVKMGRWNTRMYIAAHASWNFAQEWYMQESHNLQPIRGKAAYTKPVVVLVNATTFSSSENFCVGFRSINKGKIIGTTTGGSTGNPIGIELGCDIYAQICTKNDLDAAGNKFIGIGIIPDIEVAETADIFLNGKDVVVERALEELKKMF